MCTTNEDHTIHGSWNIRCDRQKFSTFWPIFLPFQPLDKLENQNSNIEKKHLEILFYKHKLQSYDVWFLRYGVQQTEFFVILDHFLHFYPPNLKNQNFKKMKKPPGDIIALHIGCTINENHMMYGFWNMERVADRIFCHFGPFFALLPP